MLIGLLSDTHDRLPAIDGLVREMIARGVGMVLHAGDFCAPFALRPILEHNVTMAGVFGRNDGDHEGLKAYAASGLGIELFEQPIAMSDFAGLKRLIGATGVTIALDEAATGLPVVRDLIRREAVEAIVVKVNKVGGIHYARQLCELARNEGLRLIGSGLMDASLGFAASVHVFAAYGIDYPCDLNGPQHIAADYAAEPPPRDGRFALVPKRPGIGVAVDEARVAQYALDL